MSSLQPINGVYLASELRRLGLGDRTLRDGVARGTFQRLHRGAFARSEDLAEMTPWEIYRLRCIAAAMASRTRPTLSHWSAAVFWGVPMFGAPPGDVHVLASARAGSRVEHGFCKHAVGDPGAEVVATAGISVTSLERTLVEFASTAPFAAGVAALDWAFAPSRDHQPKLVLTASQLHACADRIGIGRVRTSFERALTFASTQSESVGESVSRANMHLAGLPAPQLQKEFFDSQGFVARSDFWWEEFNTVGEFDGRGKYLREDYRRGASASDVVVAEKVREDRLRATATLPRVTRWGWDIAISPRKLFAHLTAAGKSLARSCVGACGPLRELRSSAVARNPRYRPCSRDTRPVSPNSPVRRWDGTGGCRGRHGS